MSGADIAAIFGGAVVTVSLSLIGILIGLPIGLGLALLRWANVPVVARVVVLYVSILRATPLVTLLLLLFFALPNIGVPIDPISAAILALVMNTSAFNCEVWRAALMNFPKDQYEAAKSIGMRAPQRFRRIVLPQIVRASLPGLVNEMSLLIKVTPVLAVVGVVDITRAAVRIGAETYEPLPPFLVAVALYAPIVYALVSLQRWIERRLDGAAPRADRSRDRIRLFGCAAVPPHHPAAAAVVGRPGDRQPDDPNHHGQRVPDHHRAAGIDPCGELDPIKALRAIRGLHLGGFALLGPLPHHRGRRRLDRPPRGCAALGATMKPSTKVLDVAGISKKFGAVEVLNDVSFQVDKGETVCVLGPSGSGKSTLLRCINWLERPDAGQIYLNGKQIGVTAGGTVMTDRDLSAVRTRIGMVFQHFALWPHLTVLQNVTEAPIQAQKRPKAEVRDEALALLSKVGLI